MPGLPLLGSVLSMVSLFHEEFVSYNGTHLIFKVMFYHEYRCIVGYIVEKEGFDIRTKFFLLCLVVKYHLVLSFEFNVIFEIIFC